MARAPNGTVYVAWQSMQGRASQIQLKYLQDGRWSETLAVTNSLENNWEPAIACGPDGAVWIAWDRYDGDYNVYLRRYSPGNGFGPERQVTDTPRFEAHVSVAVDEQNRPWVAWGNRCGQLGQGLRLLSWRPFAGCADHGRARDRNRHTRRRGVEGSAAGRLHRRARRRQLGAQPPVAVRGPQRRYVAVVQAPLRPPRRLRRRALGVFPVAPGRRQVGRPGSPHAQRKPQVHPHEPRRSERPTVGVLAARQPRLVVRLAAALGARRRRFVGVAGQGRRAQAHGLCTTRNPGAGRASQRSRRRALHPQPPRRVQGPRAPHPARRPASPH